MLEGRRGRAIVAVDVVVDGGDKEEGGRGGRTSSWRIARRGGICPMLMINARSPRSTNSEHRNHLKERPSRLRASRIKAEGNADHTNGLSGCGRRRHGHQQRRVEQGPFAFLLPPSSSLSFRSSSAVPPPAHIPPTHSQPPGAPCIVHHTSLTACPGWQTVTVRVRTHPKPHRAGGALVPPAKISLI